MRKVKQLLWQKKKSTKRTMESPDISAFAYSYQKNLEICLKHMEDLIKNRAYILHNKGLYTDALKFTKATEGRLRQT